MERILARIFFVLFPALVSGFLVGLVFGSWPVGVVIGVGIVGLGIQVTQPRPERGEH